MDLHTKYRPSKVEELVGQDRAVEQVQSWIQKKNTPHTILISGPSGTGKTTLARIISEALGAKELMGLEEYNCADERGIDFARDIKRAADLSPLGGKARVFHLDEVVQLPKTTQQALLKVLEEPKRTTYFILCTSSLEGLLDTFKSRCHHLALSPISAPSMRKIILRAAKREGASLVKAVVTAIVDRAEGNARTAMRLLESVLVFDTVEKQLSLVESGASVKVASLATLIMRRASWREIQEAIRNVLDGRVEELRYQILAYCYTIMMSGADIQKKSMAYLCIQAFRDSWREIGKAGLVSSCWEVCQKR